MYVFIRRRSWLPRALVILSWFEPHMRLVVLVLDSPTMKTNWLGSFSRRLPTLTRYWTSFFLFWSYCDHLRSVLANTNSLINFGYRIASSHKAKKYFREVFCSDFGIAMVSRKYLRQRLLIFFPCCTQSAWLYCDVLILGSATPLQRNVVKNNKEKQNGLKESACVWIMEMNRKEKHSWIEPFAYGSDKDCCRLTMKMFNTHRWWYYVLLCTSVKRSLCITENGSILFHAHCKRKSNAKL